MSYVGQIITIDGKPYIVEQVNGNAAISREAQPAELKNRSLPASISPEYNPNIPSSPAAAPPPAPAQEVKVLGAEPTAADEASMYAAGYEYKGQEGNQQVWVLWQKPKPPGTYAAPAGDTWKIEDAGNISVTDQGGSATFYGGQNVYYSTPAAPTGNWQLAEQLEKQQSIDYPKKNAQEAAGQRAISPQENPFSSLEVGETGAINPYKPTELIITDPRQSFAYSGGREKLMFEQLPGFIGEGFSNVVRYAWSEPEYQGMVKGLTRGMLVSPEAIKGMGAAFMAAGVYGVAVEMKGGIKYTISESMAGRYGAAWEMAGQAALFDIVLRGAGKGYDWIKGKVITEDLYYVSPEFERTSIIKPNDPKSAFVSDVSGYVIRVKKILGRTATEEITGIGRIKAAGVIEKAGDTGSRISARSIEYEIMPENARGAIGDIRAVAKENVIMEKPGGLRKTSGTISIMERAKGFTDTELLKRKAAGFYKFTTEELLKTKNARGNEVKLSAGEMQGVNLELERGTGINKNTASFRRSVNTDNLLTGKKLEAYRKPGIPEIDYIEGRIKGKPAATEPEWLFNAEDLAKRKGKGRIVSDVFEQPAEMKKPAAEPNVIKAVEQPAETGYRQIMELLPKPYEEMKPAHTQRVAAESVASTQAGKLRAGMIRNAAVKPQPNAAGNTLAVIPREQQAGFHSSQQVDVAVTEAVKPAVNADESVRQNMGQRGSVKLSAKLPVKERIAERQDQGLAQQSRLAQRMMQQQEHAQRQEQKQTPLLRINRAGFEKPPVRVVRLPKPPPIFIKKNDNVNPLKPGRNKIRVRLGEEKVKRKKYNELQPSPIQADVSKFYYGKSTAPKPTKRLLAKATISTPTREQLRHRVR